MDRIAASLMVLMLMALSLAAGAPDAAATRPPTPEEQHFYTSVVLPAMLTVKTSMPPAPQGWIVESETPISPALPDQITGSAANMRFSYTVTYRRDEGVENEKSRLAEVLAEAQRKHNAAAQARTDELTKKRSDAELALKQALKKKNRVEEKKRKKELEDIKLKLSAIPGDTERAISEETDEYVVRDTMISITISVNETSAELPDGRYYSRPKAAYAVKQEGGRVGPAGWKEDRVLLLYGDWEDAGNAFRGKVDQTPSAKVRTIAITIAGDRSRTEQFLKKMAMRDILGLLK
ncbi:MAG: hypothetical protein ACYC7L_06545 [Nitrospirota bacterium]